MTTTTETRSLPTGTRLRLAPGFAVAGGGSVYWTPETTLVETTRVEQWPFDQDRNLYVRRLDGANREGGDVCQYVGSQYLTPIDETAESEYDLTSLMEMVDSDLIGNRIINDGGQSVSPNSSSAKKDAVREAFRRTVHAYKNGTLPEYSSYVDAGHAFLTLMVESLDPGATGFAGDYPRSNRACEAVGQWLASKRPLLDALTPVEKGTSWPVRDVIAGRCEAWDHETGNLCFVDYYDNPARTVTRYTRIAHDWRSQASTPVETLTRADHGDPVVFVSGDYQGQRGTFIEAEYASGSTNVRVSVDGDERTVERCHVRAAFSTVERQGASEPTTREIDGVVWVRKDAVEADHAKAVEILHKRADEQGLCSVYDRTAREVDEATEFFKMGTRPRQRSVTGTATLNITFRLSDGETYTDDEAAKEAALTAVRNHLRDNPVPQMRPGGSGYLGHWRSTFEVEVTSVEV